MKRLAAALTLASIAGFFIPGLTGREERVVREFVERLSGRLGDRPLSVVLFGSKARGTACEDSE